MGLIQLSFGSEFNQSLVVDDQLALPAGLMTVEFGSQFNQPLLWLLN